MTHTHFTLTCYSCHSELRVPVSFAGQSAPCPNCGVTLTAPRSFPQSSNQPGLASMPNPIPAQAPVQIKPPAAPHPTHGPAAGQLPPQTPTDPLSQTTSDTPRFRAKQAIPSSDPPPNSRETDQNQTSTQMKRRWPKVLLVACAFVLILASVGGLIFFQKDLFMKVLSKEESTQNPPPIIADTAATSSLINASNNPPDETPENPPEEPPVPPKPNPISDPTPTIPEPAEEIENPAPSGDLEINPEDLNRPGQIPSSPLTSAPSPPDAGALEEASKVLEEFLTATTLEERLQLMLPSSRTAEELQAGPLSKPLPDIITFKPDIINTKVKDGLQEYYFIVALENEASSNHATVIIVQLSQWDKTHLPKVNTDAFLDLYENVPASAAASPFEGSRTIKALISHSSYCFDENVPNPGKKATIRFHGSRSKKTLAEALISQQSELYRNLASSIPVGINVPLTLTVSWNKTEDPERPYLEVVRIAAKSWND